MIAYTIPVASSSSERWRRHHRRRGTTRRTLTTTTTTLAIIAVSCLCCRSFFSRHSLVVVATSASTSTTPNTRTRRSRGGTGGDDGGWDGIGSVVHDLCRPRHLHMALGPTSPSPPPSTADSSASSEESSSSRSSSHSSMTVSFSTDFRCGPGVGAAGYQVAVLYGKKEEEEEETASPSDDDTGPMVGDGGFYDHVAFPTGPPGQYNSTHPRYGNYTSDYFHHVTLKNLDHGTTYRYRCIFLHPPQAHEDDDGAAGDEEESGLFFDEGDEQRRWSSAMGRRRLLEKLHSSSSSPSTPPYSGSASAHFTTPPATSSDPQQQRLTLAIVGDLGQTSDSATTVEHMRAHHEGMDPLAAVFHAGDLSYADCDHGMWDTWFDLIKPVADEVPWHVCPGNHEIEQEPSTGEVFTSYERRFRMPYEIEARIRPVPPFFVPNATDDGARCNCTPSVFLGDHYDFGNAYHGVTYGPVRAIFLNSYTSSDPGSNQYEWLSDQLSSVDRTVTPWLLVVMHCPFYNTFKDHAHEAQTVRMRRNFEHLFVRYEVNVVFAGHVHAYTRTEPVSYDVVAADGRAPTYVVIGDGGNREGHSREYVNPDEPEPWVARRDKTVFGFGLFDVVNATSARWRWVRNVDDALTTVVHDDVFIENQYFL